MGKIDVDKDQHFEGTRNFSKSNSLEKGNTKGEVECEQDYDMASESQLTGIKSCTGCRKPYSEYHNKIFGEYCSAVTMRQGGTF